ncbi:solute carrier family 41 member 3-like [Temnothorax curvispinosus]|uniref:Solute carrier family 41 member 3-like n=1 Tax=Temnothorax curvispinosus TaxID=300111 RepID=A0A6J1R084_9HYME|nr:solute carrier family 41 member 3-like [Temnothorax curvispinosus]XP_024888375.1 solute carrier family 41 member 3-like [Temnothorax curvispinosus]XP_024888376.1 solute carrier family 41 member 3-like [Temnothorax curvispinosus]XP_024888377.1 solute carrier family 41 member 3-like [Temnothorax curvispinosus]XP_024888379.1 solute carrier family 41 member 3-like [Temnothorax curvispinosus]
MVAFRDSEIDPTSKNGTGITSKDSNGNNDDRATDIGRVRDEAFTIRATNGMDNYALNFDNIEKINDKKLSVDINPEPVFVKKVAAGLKTSGGDKVDKKDTPGGVNGNGSLSSGSSIVTISSNAVLDPDEEGSKRRKDPNVPIHGGKDIRNEKWYHTLMQVSIPFFIAGMGTIGAGRVLTTAKNMPAFVEVPQLLILTTSLQGLKGNLDMCLASRLSTQANLGNMNSRREIVKMIVGNIALVQIQAIVAAVCLSLFGMGVGGINGNGFEWNHALMLAVSCMCTATSSCFILDFVLIAVIMISYRFKMNPDNLATPLAASIGDVVSISILSFVASEFYNRLVFNQVWVLYVVIGLFIVVLLPIWILIVLKNKYTRTVLKSGWVPILSALLISGGGGLVLERSIDSFKGSEVFQPVINGIGGNLVSVQASRMSTMLHQSAIMGILPSYGKIWVFPWTALLVGTPYAKTARLLLSMAVPGQLVFVFIADALNPGDCKLHTYFVISYLVVSLIQVMILLYVAHIIIHAMWRFKIDPDNSAIPYLTALGDLSGSLLLAAAFAVIYAINQPYCFD